MQCGKKGEEVTKKIVMEEDYETTKQYENINGKKEIGNRSAMEAQ